MEKSNLLKICSECKRIEISGNSEKEWIREEDLRYKELYGLHYKNMTLTHSYCPKCFEEVMAELKRL